MNSAIYKGTVRHRRYKPKYHTFTYHVFMVYLDLGEMDTVFQQSFLWSAKGVSLAWFRRKDFFDGSDVRSLYDVVADKVFAEVGWRPEGPIRMLTNLRYFGFIINPITCYYCFDRTGKNLQAIVAEVTNTPWKQRCHYVLDFTQDEHDGMHVMDEKHEIHFNKKMHVSPFQPMHLLYQWRGRRPSNDLLIHMDIYDAVADDMAKHANASDTLSSPIFDATLVLKREAMSAENMNAVILRYPWMTLKVCAAIYWQALKLWCKKIPFYSNPPSSTSTNNGIIK
jgi:DUF1365 family protein